MLILSRKLGESIIITIPPSTETRNIKLTYVGERGISIRLGFEASKDIIILREELYEPGNQL